MTSTCTLFLDLNRDNDDAYLLFTEEWRLDVVCVAGEWTIMGHCNRYLE